MGASVQNVLGDVATAVAAGGLANFVASGKIDSRVKCMIDSYTAGALEAAGSTIKLGKTLPSGAKVLAVILCSSVAQTALTFQLGTSYNADEFVTTGATGLQTALSAVVAAGRGYVVGTNTADNQILLTTEAATMTAGVLTAIILFAQD